MHLLRLTPSQHGQFGATGTALQLRWNRGWGHSGAQKSRNISETVQDRTTVFLCTTGERLPRVTDIHLLALEIVT